MYFEHSVQINESFVKLVKNPQAKSSQRHKLKRFSRQNKVIKKVRDWPSRVIHMIRVTLIFLQLWRKTCWTSLLCRTRNCWLMKIRFLGCRNYWLFWLPFVYWLYCLLWASGPILYCLWPFIGDRYYRPFPTGKNNSQWLKIPKNAQCSKITQNVAFELFNFGIFH